METLQVAGVILFIFGILTASSMLREGKRGLPEEHLAEAQRIERMTIVNAWARCCRSSPRWDS